MGQSARLLQTASEQDSTTYGPANPCNLHPEWLENVYGPRCLLLDAASWPRRWLRGRNPRPDPQNVARPKCSTTEGWRAAGLRSSRNCPRKEASAKSVRPPRLAPRRCDLIEAALGSEKNADELCALLQRSIDTYLRHWNCCPFKGDKKQFATDWSEHTKTSAAKFKALSKNIPGVPAFVADLPGRKWTQAFKNLAATYGWLHPGLCLAGETIVYLHSDFDALPVDFGTSTWILFADADQPVGRNRRAIAETFAGYCPGRGRKSAQSHRPAEDGPR